MTNFVLQGLRLMARKPGRLWIDQANASEDIKNDFGLDRALSYLVTE